MKPPMPFNEESGENPRMPDPDDSGFANFAADTDFLQKIKNPHFPHTSAGTHVPVWLTPKLARDVIMHHGEKGHAIPHPDLKIFNK